MVYLSLLAAIWFGSFAAYGQNLECEEAMSLVELAHHKGFNEIPPHFNVGDHFPAHELLFVNQSNLDQAVRATFRVEGKGLSATAFLIDRRGTLITNAHVVDGLRSKSSSELDGTLVNYNGISFSLRNARVLFKPDRPSIGGFAVNYAVGDLPDLAILKVPELSDRSFIDLGLYSPRNQRQVISNTIFVLGNPGLGALFATAGELWSADEGEISNTISAHVLSGYSGGPVLNAEGALVGVVFGGDPVDRGRGGMVPAVKLRQVVAGLPSGL